jgi:tetratricopeptide (TPR) repeat protein
MRHSLLSLAMLAAFAAVLPTAPAWAQRRPDNQRGDDEMTAREHYERGRAHHERREYNDAVREYLAAYELEPSPGLLFNIAQVYLLSGNRDKALDYYQEYLNQVPSGEVSDLARQRIAEIEREKAAEAEAKAKETEPQAGGGASSNAGNVPPPPSPPPPLSPRPTNAGRGLRLAGLATAGVGVLGLGLGVKFGLDASDRQQQIEGQPDGAPWTFDDVYAEGEAASRNMWISYGAGAAALVAGGVLFYLGASAASAEEQSLSIAPMWDRSGAGLVLVGGF